MRMPHKEKSAVRVEPALARRKRAQSAKELAAAVELAGCKLLHTRQHDRERFAMVGRVFSRLERVSRSVPVHVPPELFSRPREDRVGRGAGNDRGREGKLAEVRAGTGSAREEPAVPR